jgi:hypothetical protein
MFSSILIFWWIQTEKYTEMVVKQKIECKFSQLPFLDQYRLKFKRIVEMKFLMFSFIYFWDL